MRHVIYKLVLAFLILGSGIAKSQTLQWDSTFRPTKYKEQVLKFKEDTIRKSDFVFLGNSITAGTDWGKLLNINNAKQRGISGDITFGVLERLQDIIDAKPAKIFVLIGINDISRNIPDSIILDNYHKILKRIVKGSPRTKVYFNTLLPVNAAFEKFKNHYNKDQHILYLNEQIKKLKYKNLTIIDLYSNFLDENNHLKSIYTKDGLHLNNEGYEVWRNVIFKGKYLK